MGDKSFFKPIGTEGIYRLRFKIVTRKGYIIDFLIQLEMFIVEEWKAIVRYDNSHGFPHRDVISPDKTIEKKELRLPTLEQAVEFAEQDLTDRFEWYIEKYQQKVDK